MRSVRFVLAFALAFAIGVVASGCGSEVASAPEQPSASPREQLVASPPEPPNYSGLEVHSLAQDGFSIGVPKGWTTTTAAPFKLMAADRDAETCACSTVSVMAFPLNDAWKENFADAGGFAEGAAAQALPGTTPTSTPVKTPVAEGVRVTLRTMLPGSDAEVVMTQNYIHTAETVYVVSYTTSPEMVKNHSGLFNRSVQSLRET